MKDFPVPGGPNKRIRFPITDRFLKKAGCKAWSMIDPERVSFAALRPTTSSHFAVGFSDTINFPNISGDFGSVVW